MKYLNNGKFPQRKVHTYFQTITTQFLGSLFCDCPVFLLNHSADKTKSDVHLIFLKGAQLCINLVLQILTGFSYSLLEIKEGIPKIFYGIQFQNTFFVATKR